MNSTTFTIEGVSPLLMHNGQLADPLNEWAMKLAEVTKKRSKTEDDHRLVSDIEWRGGLYLDERDKPCIPGECVHSMLVKAAKAFRLGTKFLAGIIVDEQTIPLEYSGPKTVDGLQKDAAFRLRKRVKVSTSAVMRTRPRFPNWRLTFTVMWMPDMVDGADLRTVVEQAGRVVGLGDYRPIYGRFNVVEAKDG